MRTRRRSAQEHYDDYKHVNHRRIRFQFDASATPARDGDAFPRRGDAAGGAAAPNARAPSAAATDETRSSPAPRLLPTLVVEQDRHLGRGGMVFDAAFVLAEFVIACATAQCAIDPAAAPSCTTSLLSSWAGLSVLEVWGRPSRSLAFSRVWGSPRRAEGWFHHVHLISCSTSCSTSGRPIHTDGGGRARPTPRDVRS